MQELLELFSIYLEKRGASRNTLQSYLRDLRDLAVFLAKKGISEPEQISPQDLAAYLDALSAAGKSAATISRNTASLRTFFGWLKAGDHLIGDPSWALRAPKVVKRTPAVLSDEEMERLFAAPPLKTAKGLRDRAMLELLYATGLRVSELCGLQFRDVDLKQRMLVIAGSKTRLVPYDRRSARWLGKYLSGARDELCCAGSLQQARQKRNGEAEYGTELRGSTACGSGSCEADTGGAGTAARACGNGNTVCGALFVSCRGGAMSRQGVWKLLKKYGESAGIETELAPHVLRHSFAVHALRNGAEPERLRGILGHSDAATSGYLELIAADGRPCRN